ncbi:protein SINE1-like [Silene latifolia]|uniref:protein SINE1-like n=1 Tax=Silene latifolia TaxID=37657 RepID=UPI003D77FDD7
MGRNLSPALSQELANLGKGDESSKSAMKALKSYVKDLDSKAIPLFLAKVSKTKNAGSSYGECTISLYEVLARVHGPNIVSHLDDIMSTIIKTLTTSGGSFPLQQACSKVVPAIARYGIEPTTPEDKKRRIIHSLCKPLSDSLLCAQESLSCGAALCLKALVDCDNWRFASDEMVNEVCLKLASALKDTPTQTNSHMGLVISLAKRNSFVVEPYARLLVKAGLQILNCGVADKNSQKRLTAIQMVHSLMKCLDIRSIISELESIVEEMEKCQSDQIPFVKGAAFEALQTARKFLADKRSEITDSDVISVTGSNLSRSRISNGRRRNLSSSGSRSPLSGTGSASPLSGSPESQTLDSFVVYDSYMGSPISTCQASCNVNHSKKNAHRRLWRGNGCVDVSLKDGLFSELAREGSNSHASTEHDGKSGTYAYRFPGFVPGNQANGGLRSRTPSPQRTNSQRNVDNIKIYTTPRKLLRSLQDDDENSDYFHFENEIRQFRSPVTKYSECDSFNQDGLKDSSDSESVSSTKDVTVRQVPNHKLQGNENHSLEVVKNSGWKISKMFVFLFMLLVLAAAFGLVLWSGGQDRNQTLVPT